MSTRTEDRLRAALAARADLVTPDQLRPAAPPRVRSARHVLLPAAAAVAAVVAAGSALFVPGLLSHHDRTSPTPGSSASAGPSATPTSPGAAKAQKDPLATTEFAGMAVPVPAGWRLDRLAGPLPRACLHPAGAQTGVDCALLITVYGGYDPAWRADGAPFVVDTPPLASGCDLHGTSTVTSNTQQVGGRQAEFRRFAARCATGPRTAEVWTVTSYPVVQFWRAHVDPGPETTIHQVLDNLRWTGPVTSTRAVDRGYLVSSSRQGGTTHLRLDRTILVLGGPDNGMESNSNPQSYDYPVAPDVTILDSAWLCHGGALSTTPTPCALDTLVHRMAEGDHPADGGPPVRSTAVVLLRDSAGRIVRIESQYHP